MHEPSRAERVQAARAKGGRIRAINGKRARLHTVEDLVKFNARLVGDVLDGRLDSEIARTLTPMLQLQHRMLESSVQEARIAALEEYAAGQSSGMRLWSA